MIVEMRATLCRIPIDEWNDDLMQEGLDVWADFVGGYAGGYGAGDGFTVLVMDSIWYEVTG